LTKSKASRFRGEKIARARVERKGMRSCSANRAREGRITREPLPFSSRGAMPAPAQRQLALERRVIELALQSPGQKVLGVLATRIAHLMGSGNKAQVQEITRILERLIAEKKISLQPAKKSRKN